MELEVSSDEVDTSSSGMLELIEFNRHDPTTVENYLRRLEANAPHLYLAKYIGKQNERPVYKDDFNEELVLPLLRITPQGPLLYPQERTYYSGQEKDLTIQQRDRGFVVRAFAMIKQTDRHGQALEFVKKVLAEQTDKQMGTLFRANDYNHGSSYFAHKQAVSVRIHTVWPDTCHNKPTSSSSSSPSTHNNTLNSDHPRWMTTCY